MVDMICRLVVWANGKAEFASVSIEGASLDEDKKFGFLKPKSGVLTYSITNNDGEITEKNVKRAVQFALKEWSLYTPITFKHVPTDGDIQVKFMSEEDDQILNKNTLAYMYYPLGGSTNGKCVINTRFYWTLSGKGINMSIIDPVHYTPDTKTKAQTWDLDQVLRHEFGHGVFGLPHNKVKDNIMSANYGMMKEHLSDNDILRARAKAGSRFIEKTSYLKRWIDWLNHASDRDQ